MQQIKIGKKKRKKIAQNEIHFNSFSSHHPFIGDQFVPHIHIIRFENYHWTILIFYQSSLLTVLDFISFVKQTTEQQLILFLPKITEKIKIAKMLIINTKRSNRSGKRTKKKLINSCHRCDVIFSQYIQRGNKSNLIQKRSAAIVVVVVVVISFKYQNCKQSRRCQISRN